MTRRRTLKHKKSLRRLSRRDKRKSNGGGWSELIKNNYEQNAVSPGNQIHFNYDGPGKDCTGNPHSIRPGYISDYNSKGLPGLSGGKRRNAKNKLYGGAAMPLIATTNFGNNLPGPVTNPNIGPVSGSITQKPDDFPNTTGTAGTVANPVVMSMPGVPTPPGAALMPKMPIAELSSNAAPAQTGGRYGFFPEMGPLNPNNGVGTSPAPFGRIPCESGTYNSLNPNPGNIQLMTTAPLTPPYVTSRLTGGALHGAPINIGSSGYSAANFPTIQVGNVDSMRYYAPTAGYRNDFMTFRAPSAVPGLTIQTPYDAKAFNQACIKTGGSRRNYKSNYKRSYKRSYEGGGSVAMDAGKFSPVTINEIGNRMDFDGTNKGLPVKFGGKRRTRRVLKNKHKKY